MTELLRADVFLPSIDGDGVGVSEVHSPFQSSDNRERLTKARPNSVGQAAKPVFPVQHPGHTEL